MTDDESFLVGRYLPLPEGASVLDLLEAAAHEYPSSPAVNHGDLTLTYAELHDAAHEVASRLLEASVDSSSLVPLVMSGGIALPVAMIGVMKAGRAFVPVDAAWPPERIAGLLREIASSVILVEDEPSDAELGAVLQPYRQLGITVDRTASHASTPLDCPRSDGSDVIYGFFTSGSTGHPKCALNRHRGLVNRFLSMSDRFAADGAVVLQNSAHTFDSSIWQLLWPLTRGAVAVIPERDGILDFEGTVATISAHGVTMTDFVPTILDLLVERLDLRPTEVDKMSSLKQIFVGGEAVSPTTVQRLRKLLPHVRITNTFGPTEASIGSVFHAISDEDTDTIPLGRPLPNTSVLLLDSECRPVAAGEVGEIYLGGECVGVGYYGDEAKTAAAFLPNPFPSVPGNRLYRTGDFGAVRSDGLLMFHGRRDAQVKIHGVRVDLGEVESVLAGAQGIHWVKTVLTGNGHNRALVCFFSGDPGLSESSLRAHAAIRLPKALVPTRLLRVEAPPLLGNGKLDLQALHAMLDEDAAGQNDGEFDDELESEIAALWREVLQRETVGNDFFLAGGSSLNAARLAGRLEAKYGVEVCVRDIYTASTIALQAQHIRGWCADSLVDEGRTVAQVESDIFLDSATAPVLRAASGDGGSILLTGATGFVGSRILDRLLVAGQANVICLVRAESDLHAKQRVARVLRELGAFGDFDNLRCLAGDLASPDLGLPREVWDHMANDVTHVVHAGGVVNSLQGYADHAPANVDATRTVLRLAREGRPKHVWHLSTSTVLPPNSARKLPELPLPPASPMPGDGYGQSKWAAEQIIGLAATQGVATTIIRLGEVAPDSRTGAGNPRSILSLVLGICIALGQRFPTRSRTDWTPADTVATAVSRLITEEPETTGVLNFILPYTVSIDALMERIDRNHRPLAVVSYAEFLAAARRFADDDRVARALAVLPSASDDLGDPLAELLHDASAAVQAERSEALAGRLASPWHAPREVEIDRFISWLLSSEFETQSARPDALA